MLWSKSQKKSSRVTIVLHICDTAFLFFLSICIYTDQKITLTEGYLREVVEFGSLENCHSGRMLSRITWLMFH